MKVKNYKNKIENIGYYNGIPINLYEIDNKKWIPLNDLAIILGESYSTTLNRFKRLSQEWEPYSKAFFINKYITTENTNILLTITLISLILGIIILNKSFTVLIVNYKIFYVGAFM